MYTDNVQNSTAKKMWNNLKLLLVWRGQINFWTVGGGGGGLGCCCPPGYGFSEQQQTNSHCKIHFVNRICLLVLSIPVQTWLLFMTQSSVCCVNDIFTNISNKYWHYLLVFLSLILVKKVTPFLNGCCLLKKLHHIPRQCIQKYENNLNKLPIILLHCIVTNSK